MLVHNQHRPLRTGRDIPGDASGYQAEEPSTAVGADDDEARRAVLGGVDDSLPGGRSLNRDGVRPESGRLRQRGSLGGGWLGSKMPYGDDKRFAPGGQLVASLGYGGPGQVRAVVGEQDGAEPVTALAARWRGRAE